MILPAFLRVPLALSSLVKTRGIPSRGVTARRWGCVYYRTGAGRRPTCKQLEAPSSLNYIKWIMARPESRAKPLEWLDGVRPGVWPRTTAQLWDILPLGNKPGFKTFRTRSTRTMVSHIFSHLFQCVLPNKIAKLINFFTLQESNGTRN